MISCATLVDPSCLHRLFHCCNPPHVLDWNLCFTNKKSLHVPDSNHFKLTETGVSPILYICTCSRLRSIILIWPKDYVSPRFFSAHVLDSNHPRPFWFDWKNIVFRWAIFPCEEPVSRVIATFLFYTWRHLRVTIWDCHEWPWWHFCGKGNLCKCPTLYWPFTNSLLQLRFSWLGCVTHSEEPMTLMGLRDWKLSLE